MKFTQHQIDLVADNILQDVHPGLEWERQNDTTKAVYRKKAERVIALVMPALLFPEPVDERCPFLSNDPITCRYERDDNWRCGKTAGHLDDHVLWDTDGERVLYSASWSLTPLDIHKDYTEFYRLIGIEKKE